MKSDLIKIFFDERYSKLPKEIYEINKILYNDFDGITSFDLADMIDYKNRINKGSRYIFILIDNFSKFVWTIPLKNQSIKTVSAEFLYILTSSKRRPIKLGSDKGSKFHKSIIRNFLKFKKTPFLKIY